MPDKAKKERKEEVQEEGTIYAEMWSGRAPSLSPLSSLLPRIL
jgi:hypothetical protein